MKPHILTLAFSIGLIAASPLHADEILNKEPSFEGPPQPNGLPQGWEGTRSEPLGRYRFQITDEAHSGKKSLLMEGSGQYCVTWAEMLPVDRTQRYRARGFVKIEGDEKAAADVKFHYYGEDRRYLGQSRVGFVNPRTKGWQLITVTDELDLWPAAKYIGVAVAIAGDGKAWFDDAGVTATPRQAGPVNLVANGDMEDVAADRPAGWHIIGSEGNKPVASTDILVKKSGRQSLHLSGNGEWVAGSSPSIPIDRTKGYSLTGWAKVKRGKALVSWAYFADGQFLGHTESEPIAAGEWQSRTVEADLGKYPTATHLAAVASAQGDAEAWFDDFIASPKGAQSK